MTQHMRTSPRLSRILALFAQAGRMGLTYRKLADLMGLSPDNMRTTCNSLRADGRLARVGGVYLLPQWLPADAQQDAASVRAPDAQPSQSPAAQRRRRLAVRALDRASFIRIKEQQVHEGVVYPAGMRITRQEAPRGRYEAAPDYVGEFTRQWQEARR